jgi:hypothetical protein
LYYFSLNELAVSLSYSSVCYCLLVFFHIIETKLIILKIHFVNVVFCKSCVTACVLSTVHTMWCEAQLYTDSFVCF